MSYAVRNTIILLVTLTLIVGAAFIYIRFFQMAELERLQTSQTEKLKDYNSKKATSDAFPDLNETYQRSLSIIENFDKRLFATPDPDDVYDYLTFISSYSEDTRVYFDFVFVDSTVQDQYGILRTDINGYGKYSSVVNFINAIENSRLLNKINGLSLSPPTRGDLQLDDITFNFTLESYYERIPIQEEEVAIANELTLDESISTYNPFYPLIQPTVKPNLDNLTNVEQSRLIGITGSRIFIVDQTGEVISLREGDEVYLGDLETIDLDTQSATFRLNKGGITELVTLEIEQ